MLKVNRYSSAASRQVAEGGSWRDPGWGLYGAPSNAVQADQRQRALVAVAHVLAVHGYERAPVELIVRAAGISRRTFYELFSGKADAFWAAHEGARESLFAQIRSPVRTEVGWPERMETAIASACNWAAADRERALLVCGQSFTAGPHAARCHDILVTGFGSSLCARPEDGAAAPSPVRREAMIGGLATVFADRLSRGDPGSVLALAQALSAFVAAYPSCR